MRGGRRLAALALAALCAANARPALAIGVRYPDPIAVVTGERGDVVADLMSRPRSWSVEVSDRELFGDVGLRLVGVRGALAHGRWRIGSEVAQVSAEVGAETRTALRIALAEAEWTAEVGVTHDTAAIGDAPAARLTGLDVHTLVSLSNRVRVGCDIEGFRVAGIANPGADVVTSVVVSSAAGVAVTSALVVDRSLGAYACVSAAVRMGGRAVVLAGYDDGSASLSLAVAIRAKSARVVAVASAHPVLGLSRGASVGWGR